MRGGAIRPGALLVSPVFFGSIALLLLNDRVLKAAWPGLVTGKLSDVAGVAMVAILLAALLRRRGLAFGLTTMSFTLLKVVPVSAVWAAPILGGITRRDPTDLVVLLTLVPLWRWIGDRQIVGFVAPTDRDLGRWTVPLQVALVGAAVFATSATSSDCGLGGVSTLGVDGDRVLAQAGFDTFESGDFGRTWSKLSESELSDRFEGIDTEGFWSYSGRECTAAGPCFIGSLANGGVDEGAHPGIVIRLVEGDRTSDLLSVTLAQLDQVESMMPTEACGAVWISDGVGLDSPDGEHVLMPVGTAGVLHRTPDGEWEWAAVGIYGFEPNEVDDEPLGIPVASTADAVPFAWGTWVARAMPVAVIV